MEIEFYYRNISTGRPTAKHIINEKTNSSYCGFKSVFAQSKFEPLNIEFYKHDNRICSKCKNLFIKNIPLQVFIKSLINKPQQS